MDTVPVLTATAAAEILGYIPHALGYWPHSSLVALTMERRQIRATLRMDLPGWTDNTRRDATPYIDFADQTAAALAADQAATHTVAAIYAEDPWGTAVLVPYQRLLSVLADRLQRTGMPLQLGWIVTPAGWGDYLRASDPAAGRPLDEIRSSALNAELVYRGSSYADSLDAAMSAPVPREQDPDIDNWYAHYRAELSGRWQQQNQFFAALHLWQQVLSGTVAPGGSIQSADAPQVPAAPQLSGTPDAGEVMGYLLASLECRNLRDALLVQVSVGTQLAYEGIGACNALEPAGARVVLPTDIVAPEPRIESSAAREPADGRGLERQFCAVLLGTSEAGPDWTALNDAYVLFTTLLGKSSGTPLAALLTMLGWIEWHRGRGSRADRLLADALANVPEYKLAQLLRQLLERGTISGWALNPDTAWRPAANGH